MARGRLYLVPTPIGNLHDMTPRAVETLRQVGLIACEDTRRSGRLLANFNIENRKISYFEHNELKRIPQIINTLNEGFDVAVISDGGSPGLSDPAFRLVRTAVQEGIEIIALPGPTAAIPALIASGLPTDRFLFEGFLPVKTGKRKKRLEELKEFPHTIIFYESVHRIVKTLNDIDTVMGDRQLCLAREISKVFEEYLRGTASEILSQLSGNRQKGEFVIVMEGHIN